MSEIENIKISRETFDKLQAHRTLFGNSAWSIDDTIKHIMSKAYYRINKGVE